MKEFLDHFAAVVGAATLALLLFSVSHEFGYFWVVGSQFQFFVSTSDYFTNSTQWFLAAAASLFTWLDWRAVVGAKDYMLPLGKDWRTWLFPSIMALLFAVEWFFTSQPSIQFYFLFLYVWLVYGAKYIVPFADAAEPMYRNVRSAMIAVPVLAVLAFVLGQQKGVFALSAMSTPYTIRIKGSEARNRILLVISIKGF